MELFAISIHGFPPDGALDLHRDPELAVGARQRPAGAGASSWQVLDSQWMGPLHPL